MAGLIVRLRDIIRCNLSHDKLLVKILHLQTMLGTCAKTVSPQIRSRDSSTSRYGSHAGDETKFISTAILP